MNGNKNTQSISNFTYEIQNAKGQLVLSFFQMQLATKMYHWQTTSYANHKTTDKFLDKLLDLTDSFLEKYFGQFGRPALRSESSVVVTNMNKQKYLKMLNDFDVFLRTNVEKQIKNFSELKNIRDEILAEIQQAKYLFTLQ